MPGVAGEEFVGAEAGDEDAGGGGVWGFGVGGGVGEGVEDCGCGAGAAGGEVEGEGYGEVHFCGVGVDEGDDVGAVVEGEVVGDVD